MKRKPIAAYRICSSRFVLRCWEPRDADALRHVVDENREHLRPWMPWVHDTLEPLEDVLQRLREFRANFDLDKDYVYGILDPTDTVIYGSSGLHRRGGEGSLEVGYWVRKDVVGQGLGTAVAAALTRAAFEVNGVHRVGIHCDVANAASAAIARKLGFIEEGILRQRMRRADGVLRDEMVWTLLADEYRASAAASAPIEAYDVLGRRIL